MKNETQIRNIMTAWQASPARHGEVYSLRYLPHTPSKSVNGEIVIKSVKKKPMLNIGEKLDRTSLYIWT